MSPEEQRLAGAEREVERNCFRRDSYGSNTDAIACRRSAAVCGFACEFASGRSRVSRISLTCEGSRRRLIVRPCPAARRKR